jgi:hypothetical protein
LRKRGHHSRLWLRSDLGYGEDYMPPGDLLTRDNQDDDRSRHFYFKLPADLWSNGWLSILSGPALSMLLVLSLEASIKQQNREIWFSPLQAAERFDLSEDTRGRGFAELEAYGIIDRNRRPVKPDTFGDPRYRNTYDVHTKRLSVVFEKP